MDENTVGGWLERKFLDWQREQGTRQTITEFSAWVGVSRGTFAKWLNGDRTPDRESVALLALRLGPEIYDVLGQSRPDPLLEIIVRRWELLPVYIREQIVGIVERHTKEGEDVAEPKAVNRRMAKVRR